MLLLGTGLLGALVLALSQEAPRRTGTNGVGPTTALSAMSAGERLCQGRELLPAGTEAVRLVVPAEVTPGPALLIELRHRGRVLARTTAVTDTRDFVVVAPIQRTVRDIDGVTLCYTVGPGPGQVAAVGDSTPPGAGAATVDGAPANGSISIEYLRGGHELWWSHALTVVRRMGMGRGDWGGSWTAWAAAALALCAIALALRSLVRTVLRDEPRERSSLADPGPYGPLPARVRQLLRRAPSVSLSIVAIGVLNALAWSLVTPAFQVPDEQTHIGYVQQIAESGHPPVRRASDEPSPELLSAMVATRFGWLGAIRRVPGLWSPVQQRQLDRVLHARLSRRGNGDAGPADPEPPTYYALEAIPYWLASTATLVDRITLMRAFSALMAGATALLVLLFVRECLPRRPWAWTVAGIGAAFVPLFGFVSGGVNPDALLLTVSAALFLSLARAFRRGLTPRRAVLIGGVLAMGAVTKINFYGLVPGALAAVALAARTTEGAWNGRVWRLTATTFAVGVVPDALLLLLDALVWERTFILARTPSAVREEHGGLAGQLSYLWQLFFPRLPGQRTAFPEMSPPYDLWVTGFIGRFGWVTVEYAAWAYRLGAGLLAAVAVLAARALAVERAALRRRGPELAGYASMAAGLLLLIAMVALRGWAPGIKGAVQGRYLLPLLALFAALLALATRGAGERAGRAVGVAIVMVAIAWSVFGQLATVAYFYG